MTHTRSSLHNLEFYFIPHLSFKYFLLISFINHIIKAVRTVVEDADCMFHYFCPFFGYLLVWGGIVFNPLIKVSGKCCI